MFLSDKQNKRRSHLWNTFRSDMLYKVFHQFDSYCYNVAVLAFLQHSYSKRQRVG